MPQRRILLPQSYHLALGVCGRKAGLQSRYRVDVPRLIWSVWIESDRHPQLCVFWKLESRRHYSDNFCRSVVEIDRLPNYLRVAGESLLPESVAEYCEAVVFWLVFFRKECAAFERQLFQQLEKAVSDYRAIQSHRLAFAG